MQFSGILIAVFLFIATDFSVTHSLATLGLDSAVGVWLLCTLRLLWSLKHELPPPDQFDLITDFEFTAHLYIKRMGLYNIALVASVISFVVMVIFDAD